MPSQRAMILPRPVASLALPGSSSHHGRVAVLLCATTAGLASTPALPSRASARVRYIPLPFGRPVESTVTSASSPRPPGTRRAWDSREASVDSREPTFPGNSPAPRPPGLAPC